jgi:hypothetical protein
LAEAALHANGSLNSLVETPYGECTLALLARWRWGRCGAAAAACALAQLSRWRARAADAQGLLAHWR